MADLTFHYFSCSLLILSTNSSGVSIFYNFIVYLFFVLFFETAVSEMAVSNAKITKNA
mgnify:CR=1 FL=1